MASIPTTTMRIDPQLKKESSTVLEDLGLTLSQFFLRPSSGNKDYRSRSS